MQYKIYTAQEHVDFGMQSPPEREKGEERERGK
jgi:hypothetical protein